jgi:DNA-binding transcriptional MocR family regulator
MRHGLADTAVPAGCPKYLKLAKSFEHQLRSGALRVGDRLPSVRELRDAHRVSMATAVGCYLWLERQGYVRARPKSGFYVSRAPIPDGPVPAPTTRMKGPLPVRGHVEASHGVPGGALDLAPATVSPALLPMNRLNRSLRLALSAFTDNAVRSEAPAGNLRLRRQLARLVFRQGGSCSPEDLVITSGVTEALNLAVRAVAKPGDVVAVESPGCFGILRALDALRMRAIEIPHVPDEGPDRRLLARAAEKYDVKAVLLNVTCHNPTGDCVPDRAKEELVRFAATRGIALVEGDTFGELVFDGHRPRTLKAFDTTGIVLQCESLSHYVAPGFNVGWLFAGRWHAEVLRLKSFTNLGIATLPQLALAEFLESGGFEKHLKRLRVALWQSVEAARQEVLRTFPPGTRVSRPRGGFVLWIELPEGYAGEAVRRAAADAGVLILAGPVFSPTGQYARCIRIACGYPYETLQPAIGTIAGLLSSGAGRVTAAS